MMKTSIVVLGLVLGGGFVTCALAQAVGDGEVAFAAPPAPELAAALASDNPISCASPCFVVSSRYPFKTCGAECNPDVCNRGYGVFQSQAVCCEVSFPDGGCTSRPNQCWVVESFQLRTCVRDDRKCLQGYGVYPSEAPCCTPSAAFPQGCGNVTKAAEPCWVVDTYWPSRQCRQSRTLCGSDSGVRSFANKTECCAPNGAFSEGCSTYVPPVPCWVVDSYYPDRSCRRSSDVAVCNRGWGVFSSQEVCCAPGAGFNEGCSQKAAPPAAGPAATPAAPAATPPAAAATPPAPAAAAAAQPPPAATTAGAQPITGPASATTGTAVPPVTTVSTAPLLPGASTQGA